MLLLAKESILIQLDQELVKDKLSFFRLHSTASGNQIYNYCGCAIFGAPISDKKTQVCDNDMCWGVVDKDKIVGHPVVGQSD